MPTPINKYNLGKLCAYIVNFKINILYCENKFKTYILVNGPFLLGKDNGLLAAQAAFSSNYTALQATIMNMTANFVSHQELSTAINVQANVTAQLLSTILTSVNSQLVQVYQVWSLPWKWGMSVWIYF